MYSGHFDPVAYSAAYATGRELIVKEKGEGRKEKVRGMRRKEEVWRII